MGCHNAQSRAVKLLRTHQAKTRNAILKVRRSKSGALCLPDSVGCHNAQSRAVKLLRTHQAKTRNAILKVR